MKTLDQQIVELREELKAIAAQKVSELSNYPPSLREDIHHITGSMRRNVFIPFTERVAAEILHYASAP